MSEVEQKTPVTTQGKSGPSLADSLRTGLKQSAPARSKPVLSAAKLRIIALFALAFTLASLITTPHARAQEPLHGVWVDRAEERIAQHRKTDVRIIVLDADDNPVEGATVRITQQRHDFPVGFTLTGNDWPEAIQSDAPLWRSFNAVALDALTHWPTRAPQRDAEPDNEALERILRAARQADYTVRFGEVISADLGRNRSTRAHPARSAPGRLHRALR